MKLLTKHVIGLIAGLTLAGSSSALNIVINAQAGLAGNAQALAAFNRAASKWSAVFSDPVTINIQADFFDMGSSTILGSASSGLLAGGYNTVRNQMVLDAADEAGNSIVAALPTAAQFSGFLPAGFSFNGNVVLTRANAKALGFAVSAGNDSTISFNNTFAFDFDNSDGVTAGTTDFETVAAHEIGHALGFVSWVDEIDYLLDNGMPQAVYMTTLDLFRFGPGSNPTTVSDFTNMPRNFVPGAAAYFDDLANEYLFSTGTELGDGRQASHWKDDQITGNHIGLMDPTLSKGLGFAIDPADIRALDLIGWDYVPEPGSLALVGLAFIALAASRKRRH